MMHINLNMILYTHVEHSPTKTIYIKYYMEKQTCTRHTHIQIHTHTHNDSSRNWVLILAGMKYCENPLTNKIWTLQSPFTDQTWKCIHSLTFFTNSLRLPGGSPLLCLLSLLFPLSSLWPSSSTVSSDSVDMPNNHHLTNNATRAADRGVSKLVFYAQSTSTVISGQKWQRSHSAW